MTAVEQHVRRHRPWLAVTYSVVVLENVFELLYPFAIGQAVDGLLDDSWDGVVLFVSISIAHIVVSLGRQVFDTRSFNRLYADIASDLIAGQRAAGVATSSVAARTALAGEYVGFLERDVVAAITASFAVLGSLVMLFLYDPVLGWVSAALALPVAAVNFRLLRRSRRVYRELNDQTELEVSIIDRGSHDEVKQHFRLLTRHWNRLSDTEASSWGVVELIAVGLAVFALYRATEAGDEVGAIFATIAYVWAYIGGFDQVPAVVQRMSSLGDIKRRLAEAAQDPTA